MKSLSLFQVFAWAEYLCDERLAQAWENSLKQQLIATVKGYEFML